MKVSIYLKGGAVITLRLESISTKREDNVLTSISWTAADDLKATEAKLLSITLSEVAAIVTEDRK